MRAWGKTRAASGPRRTAKRRSLSSPIPTATCSLFPRDRPGLQPDVETGGPKTARPIPAGGEALLHRPFGRRRDGAWLARRLVAHGGGGGPGSRQGLGLVGPLVGQPAGGVAAAEAESQRRSDGRRAED